MHVIYFYFMSFHVFSIGGISKIKSEVHYAYKNLAMMATHSPQPSNASSVVKKKKKRNIVFKIMATKISCEYSLKVAALALVLHKLQFEFWCEWYRRLNIFSKM